MKLERVRYFNDEISRDNLIQENIQSYDIYHYFKGNFFKLCRNEAAASIVPQLEKTRKKKSFWREPSNTRTFFYSPEFDTVLVADFFSPPKTDTQKYINLALENCARHANNAFHAAHDSLTELLNRHSLENELLSMIIAPEDNNLSDLATQNQIAVLAFDIDHFKQVNDTYGHLYGDIVLRSFARRIELLANNLITDGEYKDKKTEFLVSRPGGEEFTVIVKGFLSDSEICNLADKFRDEIAAKELPTLDEWAQYEELGLTTGLTFPLERERKITCSVGVVSSGFPTSGASPKQTITNLLNRADLALYKAKTSGRNRVCYFPDIVKKYGRVLEVNSDTGILVIDLGSEVGLKYGQELLVFHPKFDGSTDYVHLDGRTSKRMGTYPRLYSARIEAFDVQKEISFCRLLELSIPENILQKDSWLEAVPIGVISHLVKSQASSGLSSAKANDGPISTELLKERISEIDRPFCAVLRIADEETVIENLGAASVNKILANLYNQLKLNFSILSSIGYIQPTQFALVLSNSVVNDSVDLVKDILTKINDSYGGKVRVVAGIFDPETAEDNSNLWLDDKVNYSKSLELAALLSLIAINKNEEVCMVFNESTLTQIANKLEEIVGPEQALDDLMMLSEYGIKKADFENSIAKVAFVLKKYDLALEKISLATSISPSTPIFWANFGLIYFMQGNYKEAYINFSKAEVLHSEGVPLSYLGAMAQSAYKARLEGENIEQDKVKLLVQKSIEGSSKMDFCDISILLEIQSRLEHDN